MRQIALFLSGIIITVILSGCAAMMGGKTDARFYSETKKTKISITEADPTTWEYVPFDSLGIDSGRFKMSNATDNYYIKQELDGYKTSIIPLQPSKYNMGKVAGYLMALTTDLAFILMASSETSGDNTAAIVPLFFAGLFGWFVFPAGPKYMYEKKYELPVMIPFPKKKDSEKNIVVEQAAIKIAENDMRWEYYESFSDYMKGNKMYSSSSGKQVSYENTVFTDDLNKLLAQYNYRDTTKKILANTFNTMRLKATVTGYTTVTAGNNYMLQLDTRWTVQDYFSRAEKMSFSTTSKSRWLASSSPSDDQVHNLLQDALENSLISFLNDPQAGSHLKSEMDHYDAVLGGWEQKTIKYSETASTIAEVSKAVVTIKTKEGHGSGCLLSRDGLILTNHHVVGDSLARVQVIFEDGTKDSGTVIRVNPLYDLALVQVKPVQIKPLHVNRSKTIETGTEVFAVGTPEDVDLGQTVTKGIISGKRKVDEKIYIQTDVSISPGNSGGALIEKNGMVVGIINAKIIGKGIEGIGFAIPAYYIEEAMKVKFTE